MVKHKKWMSGVASLLIIANKRKRIAIVDKQAPHKLCSVVHLTIQKSQIWSQHFQLTLVMAFFWSHKYCKNPLLGEWGIHG